LLARDYVRVELAARYSNSAAAFQRAGGAATTVPWVAILDDRGKQLAASDRAEPNAGPALNAPGVARMEKMLRDTAMKLTPDEIQSLVKSLWIP
jgi:hypothetical protein